jgi:hypothetical protein
MRFELLFLTRELQCLRSIDAMSGSNRDLIAEQMIL